MYRYIKILLILTIMSLSLQLQAKQVTLKWVGCGITKNAFMKELAAGYEKKTGIKIDIYGGGATRGIRDVVSSQADIGGSCRYKIEGAKDEYSATFRPVAWDALVVIVHPDNPVKNVTFEQVRAIYLGEITNWKQLGGNDAPVRLLARESKISGVGRAIRRLIFANYYQEFKAAELFKSSGPLEKAIEKDINAVGITGISSVRKRNVKSLLLEGIEPTYENIRRGYYSLYRPLYLVFDNRGKQSHEVKRFINFAHSRAGREIIRNSGTVPYLDALGLVMKQVEQEERASAAGLYR